MRRTLVSSGAYAFAQRNGIETVDSASMVAPCAKEDWQRWMERYDEVASADELEADTTVLPQDAMQDTVGAVAWDSEGNLAAGVSSGGLLLKYSGRIGEAATFGVGCWAEQSQNGQAGMACSISGAGEHIMRTGLASTIAGVLRTRKDGTEIDVHDLLTRTLSTRFYDPIMARGDTHPNAGVLLMTKEAQESGDVIRAPTIVKLYPFTHGLRLMSSEVVVRIHHRKHGSCPYKKNAARQKFYVVPELRNQSLRRLKTPRLFISLLYPSTGEEELSGWELQLGKYHP
ncbi:nucleophile aminohydrolase [Lanmaoa asiatica]|nr:nucleophile aminohydrolase [Lanmaoa asiatica]